LVRRFSLYGVLLVFISLAGLAVLLLSFYHHPEFISKSVAASLASFVRSAFVVGIVLSAAPVIAPFLITSPRSLLPTAEVGNKKKRLLRVRGVENEDASTDAGPQRMQENAFGD
jgi:hypothetical protein